MMMILADFTNAVVWMVFTFPLISKSYSSCTNPLVAVPSTPITIGITVILMSHSFSVLKLGQVDDIIYIYICVCVCVCLCV